MTQQKTEELSFKKFLIRLLTIGDAQLIRAYLCATGFVGAILGVLFLIFSTRIHLSPALEFYTHFLQLGAWGIAFCVAGSTLFILSVLKIEWSTWACVVLGILFCIFCVVGALSTAAASGVGFNAIFSLGYAANCFVGMIASMRNKIAFILSGDDE